MPASGAMGGVSIAQPQDLTSAINANPATLTQFAGTQFLFGGAWVEPTYNLSHVGGVLPNVGTFSAKSEAPGLVAGNIGVTQSLSSIGVPATFGLAFISDAAGAADFRQVPASNGTNAALTVLEMSPAVGVALNEQWSLGGSLSLGTGFFDGPFVGVGGMTTAYGIRGTVGLSYAASETTRLGMYWQSKQNFRFKNALELAQPGGGLSAVFDVHLDLPDNVGLGIANSSLLGGNLLLAADVLYKQWDNADFFRALYNNQWVAQFGAQYRRDQYRLRLGYVYAGTLLDPNPGVSAGGVAPPGAVAAIQYAQGLMAITSPHRLSAGFGKRDVLPGLDFDMFAGGMFNHFEQIGAFTSSSIESYWIGLGLTWRGGGGRYEDSWALP